MNKLLHDELLGALTEMLNIPGMEGLQPTIDALKTRIRVPEGDYNNVAKFIYLVFEEYGSKIKTSDMKHVKALIDLANIIKEQKTVTPDIKTRMK